MWARKPFNGNYQETSPYGPRIHPVTGQQDSFHTGIDFALPEGTPLIACVNGKIVKGEDDINGKFIQLHFITEANTKGFFLYDHLSEQTLEKKVKTGDQIGLSGATGRVTGPCFHFAIFLMLLKDKKYRSVNPKTYVNFLQ